MRIELSMNTSGFSLHLQEKNNRKAEVTAPISELHWITYLFQFQEKQLHDCSLSRLPLNDCCCGFPVNNVNSLWYWQHSYWNVKRKVKLPKTCSMNITSQQPTNVGPGHNHPRLYTWCPLSSGEATQISKCAWWTSTHPVNHVEDQRDHFL